MGRRLLSFIGPRMVQQAERLVKSPRDSGDTHDRRTATCGRIAEAFAALTNLSQGKLSLTAFIVIFSR